MFFEIILSDWINLLNTGIIFSTALHHALGIKLLINCYWIYKAFYFHGVKCIEIFLFISDMNLLLCLKLQFMYHEVSITIIAINFLKYNKFYIFILLLCCLLCFIVYIRDISIRLFKLYDISVVCMVVWC